MLKALMLTLGTLAATTAMAASQSAADGNACVFFRTVHDYRALDKNKLVVWAPGRRAAYLVEVGTPLLDLTWANQLAFVDSNHDGRLCGYGMDRIVIGDTSFPQWSTITSMKPLDERELAQLEQQYNVILMGKKKSPDARD
jgi:hypothetical protein